MKMTDHSLKLNQTTGKNLKCCFIYLYEYKYKSFIIILALSEKYECKDYFNG